MPNNPTIDGVPRELLELSAQCLTNSGYDAAFEDLRALLDAPAVERQEPKPYPDRLCHIDYTAHPYLCGCLRDDDEAQRIFDEHTVAALQSTIARLEARVAVLEQDLSNEMELSEGRHKRIAELESGRGEPVAWMCFDGEGNYDFTEDPETAEAWRKSNGDQYAHWLTPLFIAPTAPVAVLPTAEQFRNAFVSSGYIDEGQSEDLSEIATRACLDATAALNGVKS